MFGEVRESVGQRTGEWYDDHLSLRTILIVNKKKKYHK